jgi:F-type H+-transporting ATPase subunit b
MICFDNRKVRTAVSVGLTLLIMLAFCGMALASGGGEGGHHDSGAQMTNLMYRLLNFALLVIILVVILKKVKIGEFFARRREEISEKLETLQKEKDEAEKRCQSLEKKLKEFEIERKEILEQFKAEGVKEKEKIIAEARERAVQILTQADLTIEREIQGAKDILRKEMVDLAAGKARDIIAKEMTDKDQDYLVNEFIESVRKLH